MSHRISNLTRPSGGQVVGDLPPGELEELAARSTEVTVEPGANVITLDDQLIRVRTPELERSLRSLALERAIA